MSERGMTRREFAAAAGLAAGAAFADERRNPIVDKAMESMRAAIPLAEADPMRPAYHFRPPANWNNDPNGTIYYKGWHHLFYQLNPYGSEWGHMHWGHARSRDLVNWEHLPIALWPSLEKGEEHVFSGGATLGPDGRPRVFYTSIGKRDPEQWMALPLDDDLIRWEKSPANPVLTTKVHGRAVEEWRDPFLFRENGQVYMVCGGRWADNPVCGGGAVQLYAAENAELTKWRWVGPLYECRDQRIVNIECPNFFKLGDTWVLLMSPNMPCEYLTGQMDWRRNRFMPEARGTLDPGQSYATNISRDPQGRTILWMWGRTETPMGKGWNGCMTIPQVLSVDRNGFLRQEPVSEIETLRGEAQTAYPGALTPGARRLPNIEGDSLEIEAEFSCGESGAVGLRVRAVGDGTTGAMVAYEGERFSAAGAATLVGRRKRIKMRVFVDKCVVEAFLDDGVAAIFMPLHEPLENKAVEAFATGAGARLESLTAWPLKPARFSLDAFR